MKGSLAGLFGVLLLWSASVQPGTGTAAPITRIEAVPMVGGCPELRGAGLDFNGMVLGNPNVRRNLEALRCGLTLEGYPPGVVDVIVSGGDSYVSRDGRVLSRSSGVPVSGRKRNSAHNVENGARAVDLWRTGRLTDREFYRVMSKYTAFRSPHGHGHRHRHLSLGWQFNCGLAGCSESAAD